MEFTQIVNNVRVDIRDVSQEDAERGSKRVQCATIDNNFKNRALG